MATVEELKRRNDEQIRRRMIVEKMLAAGETNLAKIGRKAGLTRERVRQIKAEIELDRTKVLY